MTAYTPIPPRKATEICDLAQIAGSIERLADFAEAGIVKGYARLTETVYPDGRREEVRDKRISRETWRRIISEGKVADVEPGTVRLSGSPEFGGGPKVNLIGIRFDDASVQALARAHGTVPPGRKPPPPPPEGSAASQPSSPPPPPPSSPGGAAAPASPANSRQGTLPLGLGAGMAGIPPGTVSISVEDASRASGIGRTKMYELIGKGQIKIAKAGRRTLVLVESLRDFLTGQS